MSASPVPLVWVDAFCDRAFGGNPAAVCPLGRPAPTEAMQSLALELGLSETAFTWPTVLEGAVTGPAADLLAGDR